MSPLLLKDYQQFSEIFEKVSHEYFKQQREQVVDQSLNQFWDALEYTYFLDAKRFRPFLVYLTSRFFNKEFSTSECVSISSVTFSGMISSSLSSVLSISLTP